MKQPEQQAPFGDASAGAGLGGSGTGGADTPTIVRFRRAVAAGCAGTALLALAGLLGYVPGLRLLGSLRTDYVPMAPSTAGCFLVLAAVLFWHVRWRDLTLAATTHAPLPWVSAGVVTLFAVIKLAGDILGLDITRENRMSGGFGTLGGIPIGQMSPATALLLVLAGAGTLLLGPATPNRHRSPRRALAASWLGALVVLLSGTVLLGYAFGTPFMYSGHTVPMAATTALAFVLLGAALAAAAGPESFCLRLVIGDSTSARLARVFIPLAVVVELVQGVLSHAVWPAVVGSDALLLATTLVAIVAVTAVVVARFARTFGRTLDERQRQLEQSEQRHRAVVRTAMDGFWRHDAQGHVLEVNEAYCRMSGYSEQELLTMRVSDLALDEPAGAIAEHMRAIVAEGRGRFELRHRRKDGSMFDVAVSVQTQPGDGGEMVSFMTDITDRKRADLERQIVYEIAQSVATSANLDELLSLMHRSLQRVIDAPNCFVALRDPRTELFSFSYFVDQHDALPEPTAMANSATAYVFRRGEPLLITPGVFGQLLAQHDIALVGSPSPSWMGVPLRTPSRTIGVLVLQHYDRENAYSLRDLAFLATVGSQVATVIERKLAEAALRDSEAELNVILEATSNGLLAVDTAGRVLRANRRFAEMWRLPQSVIDEGNDAELLRRVVDQLAEPEAFLSLVQQLYNSTDESRDTLQFKDGRVFERFSAPLRLSGEVGGRVWTFRDITDHQAAEAERARLEAALQHAQRMESVGRLAGGIAHDFNNMLGVILGRAELALTQDDLPVPLRDDLTEIQKAALRSADLTRQLLAYARRQRIAPRVMDMNDAIAQLLQMLRRLIGEDITLVWQPAAALWPTLMDSSQLDHLLTNLCVNSRDAIVDIGQITISTANRVLDAAFCASHPFAKPGEYVVLTVADSGAGMSSDLVAQIFEPFFTTKGVGEGTGLGLATVFGAVRQNNGFITVDSAPGQGATFDIYLPRFHGEQQVGRAAEELAPMPRGQATILLVEDEPALLVVTARTLEAQGYTVLRAHGPGEALRLATAHDGEIDLLLTDVVMPGMNGRDLAKQLVAAHPKLRLLFMSGFSQPDGEAAETPEDDAHFIGKPFALSALGAKVRDVLDRH